MGREHLCVYGFAGRNAMQTLGLLVTQRMDRMGLGPIGFVSTDYATLIWSLDPAHDPAPLFAGENLREGLETWLAGNAVMKRTFKAAATIAGLLERNTLGAGPQIGAAGDVFSSDILYDTLRNTTPTTSDEDHPRGGHAGPRRLRAHRGAARAHERRIDHVLHGRVTPLRRAALSRAGRVPVEGRAAERILAEETERLLAEAGLAS